MGIAVEDFDPKQPLVIDPVPVFPSYLGGTKMEYGEAIAVDVAGNAYLTGFTKSNEAWFTRNEAYKFQKA